MRTALYSVTLIKTRLFCLVVSSESWPNLTRGQKQGCQCRGGNGPFHSALGHKRPAVNAHWSFVDIQNVSTRPGMSKFYMTVQT